MDFFNCSFLLGFIRITDKAWTTLFPPIIIKHYNTILIHDILFAAFLPT